MSESASPCPVPDADLSFPGTLYRRGATIMGDDERNRPAPMTPEENFLSLDDTDPPDLAELGFADWAASLPVETEPLVDMSTGTPVRWVEGQGWIVEPE